MGAKSYGARIILDKKAVARDGRGKPVLISRQGEYGKSCQVGGAMPEYFVGDPLWGRRMSKGVGMGY